MPDARGFPSFAAFRGADILPAILEGARQKRQNELLPGLAIGQGLQSFGGDIGEALRVLGQREFQSGEADKARTAQRDLAFDLLTERDSLNQASAFSQQQHELDREALRQGGLNERELFKAGVKRRGEIRSRNLELAEPVERPPPGFPSRLDAGEDRAAAQFGVRQITPKERTAQIAAAEKRQQASNRDRRAEEGLTLRKGVVKTGTAFRAREAALRDLKFNAELRVNYTKALRDLTVDARRRRNTEVMQTLTATRTRITAKDKDITKNINAMRVAQERLDNLSTFGGDEDVIGTLRAKVTQLLEQRASLEAERGDLLDLVDQQAQLIGSPVRVERPEAPRPITQEETAEATRRTLEQLDALAER